MCVSISSVYGLNLDSFFVPKRHVKTSGTKEGGRERENEITRKIKNKTCIT